MELETFMVESAALDLNQFCKLHKTPTLVFTPEALMGTSSENMRVDTPGSRVMRLEKTGEFARKKLAIISQRFKGDAASEDEDLYSTHCDDDEHPKTKKHAARRLRLDDESHVGSGRVCKVSKGTKNPFAGVITIGRALNNDIVIENATVSKVHAFITTVGKNWYITDQSSTNKTYLNGTTLTGKKNFMLHDNDKLSFGRESFATFFMPEGLWRFVALCSALAEQKRPKRAVTRRRSG